MGFSRFLTACRGILRNPGVSPLPALLRHALWHPARRLLPMPTTLELTAQSRLFLEDRAEMNGCVAHVWSERLYDFHNMSFVRELGTLGLVTTAFDIGANIGIYSLLLSETPNVNVHAFEPHPSTFATLVRMLERNQRANVTAWQVALSDAAGTLLFSDEAFSPLNKVLDADDPSRNSLRVPCETGEAFCHRLGVSPDLLKIDTEGLEPAVLRGFGDRLSSVKYILAEMNAPMEVLSQILPPEVFDGPLHVDFPNRQLRRQRHNHEDALYVNRVSLAELAAHGFALDPG